MRIFRETVFSPLGGLCPEIFTCARDWPRLPSAHPNRDGGPQKIFNRENLKFGLKFSVCTSITSGLIGLVGIFSPNFFSPRDELWSTNEKVTARILMHPNWWYTVSWRICQVILFGLIHQLPLLRVEFRIPKFTFHSDLRRRAASRRALPCPSSVFHISMTIFTTLFCCCLHRVIRIPKLAFCCAKTQVEIWVRLGLRQLIHLVSKRPSFTL